MVVAVLAVAVAVAAAGLSAATAGADVSQRSQTPTGDGSVAVRVGDTALAVRGVTVIDVTNGERRADQTVVVVGNRIRAVGPTNRVVVPPGARVVEAQGKYLIPGFWDMHAHLTGNVGVIDSVPEAYPVFIAHGVTGIREMAQRFGGGAASFRQWQREIMAGTRIGPRGVGPSADVSEANGIEIGTVEDAVRVIDSLKAAGDAFVKFHGTPDDRTLFFALAREARRAGLPLVGHIPKTVTDVEAADSGMRGVEHVLGHFRQCLPNWPDSTADWAAAERRCAPVVRAYIRNGTWLTPTLSLWQVLDKGWGQPQGRKRPALLPDGIRLVGMLHRMGLRRFLAGSDWISDLTVSDPRPFTPVGPLLGLSQDSVEEVPYRPGLSVVEELVLLARAGLTPLEALQAGTLNPAKFFAATDSLGTVAPGKLADLVLLDGDPLRNIRNVLKPHAVVANGRYFDRAALDALDPEGSRGMLADEPAGTGASPGEP